MITFQISKYTMKKSYKRKRGPVQAKKVTYDGIKFASGLERYMYQALKKAKIKATCIARSANGKGDYKDRGNKKILPIKYTPDFIGCNFIIECKGRANESFPLRWKLFKKHLKDNNIDTTLYKPQNQKECDRTVELILNL